MFYWLRRATHVVAGVGAKANGGGREFMLRGGAGKPSSRKSMKTFRWMRQILSVQPLKTGICLFVGSSIRFGLVLETNGLCMVIVKVLCNFCP